MAELEGLEALVARMRGLSTQVHTVAAPRAVRAGGKVIQAAMTERAPVQQFRSAGSNSLEPGELRGDIRNSVVVDGDEVAAIIGPSRKTAQVARWVEYGHRMVKGGYSKVLANGKTRGPGKASEVDVPAHPFLRPAYEESVGVAEEAVRATLLEEIGKEGA